MTQRQKIHFALIAILNLAIIFNLIETAWNGNDKAILLVLAGYFALTVLNALVWLALWLLKIPERKIYKTATLALLILFLPTVMISSLY